MNRAAHTPGPWLFDGDYVWAAAIGGYVADPQTEDVLSGEEIPLRDVPETLKANGYLIAAAPEMLEVLQATLTMTLGNSDKIFAKVRAVLAKATGAQS